MNFEYIYKVEAERRKDEIAFAEKERLIRRILKKDSSLSQSYRRWLARLGTQMVSWGNRLQARYADALATSALPRETQSGTSTV